MSPIINNYVNQSGKCGAGTGEGPGRGVGRAARFAGFSSLNGAGKKKGMAYSDRIAAWQTLLAAHRTNNATLTTTMAAVSTNTISAQNITDINAAIAAIAAAVVVANAQLTRPD